MESQEIDSGTGTERLPLSGIWELYGLGSKVEAKHTNTKFQTPERLFLLVCPKVPFFLL